MKKGIIINYIFGVVFLSLGFAVGLANADVESGLVAYYSCEEGEGSVVHNQVEGTIGEDGVANGVYEWVEGAVGNFAILFDGAIGSFVDCGTWNPSEGTGQLTAAAWINWGGLTGQYQGVVSKRDGWTETDTCWHVEINTDTGDIAFGRWESYPGFGTNIPPIGEWQHVAVTFDGSTTTMYIDGESVGTSTVFSFGPKTDAHVVFGAVESSGSNPFNGVIDEVRIYNRALSADDITELYNWTGLADAGPEQKVTAGDRVALDGSGPEDADFSWEQTGGLDDFTVTLEPSADQASVEFDTPEREIGFLLTFLLTTSSPTKGTATDQVNVYVYAPNTPRLAPANLRSVRTDQGFWLYWDDIFDAEVYEVQIEYFPDVWVPIAARVDASQYEIKDQESGTVIPVRVIAKNDYGNGPVSETVSVTIMRNVALPKAAGGPSPPTSHLSVGGGPVPAMNDSVFDVSANSSGATAETGDFWGYLWDSPLWFDEIVYAAGLVSYDGGWFTDLAVEYTEDGTTWVKAPNVLIDPPYEFINALGDREDFTSYTITFGAVRGTGIRIFGGPGGMNSFTSVAELEVYGIQTRGDLVVQGLDLEVPERGTGTLDGSYSMSLLGDIVSYSWSQTSGPTVAIADATAGVTTFTAPVVEEDTVLVFSLTAGDGTNEGTDEDVRITVKNIITTAVAGVDQTVVEGTVVSLDGTGSLTATGDLTYSWAQTAGVEVSLSDAGAAVCSFTAPEIWPYVQRLSFRLDVDDGEGGTGSDEVHVNVMNSVFETKPLPAYYFRDLLHLGNTPEDRFLSPLDLNLDTNDYLANWGGQANVNPVQGEAYDFIDTGITTTVNPMIWTPAHYDDGFFGDEELDNFGQIYHIYVFSPDTRDARIRMRFDDECRVLDNGLVVFSREAWDGGSEDAEDFSLNEGINSMTLRFEDGTGGNFIAARLTDRNDVPYTDLSYALSVRSPLPAAYGVRSLPDSYNSPGTLGVEVSVRADPDNLPGTIAVREVFPEGVTVADAGGGTPGAGTLTWTFDGVSSAVVSYSLSVPAGTTAALAFNGDTNGEDTLGDGETYAVPSAPLYVSLDTMFGAQLSWSPPPEEGADAYRVYRSLDGGDWEQVAFTRETSYTEGLSDWSTYSYKVMAVNRAGVEGPFSEATEAATVAEIPVLREGENYNYGGGVYPGYQECAAANEAPDSDTVGTPEDYDFFFAEDIPVDDTRRFYRPSDNCAMETVLDDGTTDKYHTNIGWVTAGDWWRYTFNVPEPGAEDPPGGWARVGLRMSCSDAATAEFYWDEGLLGSITFDTDSWHAMKWFPLEDAFRTSPGEHTLRVRVASGQLNLDQVGLAFNLKLTREAIFEDDFEDYTNLYNWNDLETFGNWDVTNGSAEPDVGWRLWNTAGDYLGDETEDRHPAIAGMTGNYVISDSDLVGTADLDEELVTPDIDCTEWIRLKLDFSKNFRVYPDDYDHSQIAEVDIHVWDADLSRYGDWVNLLSYDVNSIDPDLDPALDSSPEKLDLSAYDGEIFQLRWRFYDASWDWWFAIDNVMVSGEPKPTEVIKGVVQSIGIAEGNLSLTWNTFGGETYYIEHTADLTSGVWDEVAGPLTGASSPPIPISGSAGYYRISSQ